MAKKKEPVSQKESDVVAVTNGGIEIPADPIVSKEEVEKHYESHPKFSKFRKVAK